MLVLHDCGRFYVRFSHVGIAEDSRGPWRYTEHDRAHGHDA